MEEVSFLYGIFGIVVSAYTMFNVEDVRKDRSLNLVQVLGIVVFFPAVVVGVGVYLLAEGIMKLGTMMGKYKFKW